MSSDDDEVPTLVADGTILTPTQPPSETHDIETTGGAANESAPPTTTTAVLSTGYVRDPNAPPVPLTILTGWLGAGKTTLLTRQPTHTHTRMHMRA